MIRQKSSHCRLRHPDGRVTTVPVHAGETIGPGLLNKIIRDCDMTSEQLSQLL
jgi:predicted RNA binding protein YcfA (HicA-like mRNA interferase family)